MTQRAAVRRSAGKLRKLDPSNTSYSGTLKRRAQKAAVTRAGNKLAAAKVTGRRTMALKPSSGVLKRGTGKTRPAGPAPAPTPTRKRAVRGRQRLKMFSIAKDGIFLKKVIDAYKSNPFIEAADPKGVARNVLAAKTWLKKRGYRTVDRAYEPGARTIADAIRGQKHSIGLNEESSYWQFPRLRQRKNRLSGWHSSGAPTATLHHEIGHTRERKYGKEEWSELVSKAAKPETKAKRQGELVAIAKKVSQYATHDPSEFIAEVYAGLRTGQRYDSQVMNLYRKLMKGRDPGLKARRGRRPRHQR